MISPPCLLRAGVNEIVLLVTEPQQIPTAAYKAKPRIKIDPVK